jgi:hypothetical protein
MLKTAYLFTLVLLSSLNVFGTGDARLDKLFGDAINAVGNKSDLGKVKSIVAVAECVGPKGEYKTTVTSFRDDRTAFEQTYSYKPSASVFINGSAVWENSAEPSVSTPFQRMVARSHEYQKMAFDLPQFFTDPELVGEVSFAGKVSTKVKAKNELGMTSYLYFDKATSRFSGYVLEIPNSTETITNVILEWKTVGNLTLPSVVKATDKQGEWTLRFNSIKLNAANDSRLKVPTVVSDHVELMRLHEQHKTAHLTNNVDLFVGTFADEITQIQNGMVVAITKDKSRERFEKYFANFKFEEWSDINPPKITISKDGTMAAKTVEKRVRGTYKYPDGTVEADDTTFAWLEVWRKIGGKWKVTMIASTVKPGGMKK